MLLNSTSFSPSTSNKNHNNIKRITSICFSVGSQCSTPCCMILFLYLSFRPSSVHSPARQKSFKIKFTFALTQCNIYYTIQYGQIMCIANLSLENYSQCKSMSTHIAVRFACFLARICIWCVFAGASRPINLLYEFLVVRFYFHLKFGWAYGVHFRVVLLFGHTYLRMDVVLLLSKIEHFCKQYFFKLLLGPRVNEYACEVRVQ